MEILKIHSRKMNLMRGIDLRKIAEQMTGASGAETKAVCTEAGMFALRERRIHVTQEDFEMAVAKVMKKDIESNLAIRRAWKWICEKIYQHEYLDHFLRKNNSISDFLEGDEMLSGALLNW